MHHLHSTAPPWQLVSLVTSNTDTNWMKTIERRCYSQHWYQVTEVDENNGKKVKTVNKELRMRRRIIMACRKWIHITILLISTCKHYSIIPIPIPRNKFALWTSENTATGEMSPVITPFHFFGFYHKITRSLDNLYHLITLITW